MPDFNILRESEIKNSFRVKKIMSDFDLNVTKSKEVFSGSIDLSKEWQIGVIVGSSGTGKTTIAKEIFSKEIISGFDYCKESVIDDMPNCNVDDITNMFYSVGFGSVPSWLKPYKVLSNGEKMRVDLARALLEKDFVVYDEFTSVVDRNVAKTLCIALNKYIKKTSKKFIAISCHYDIIEKIEPDWVFDTDKMSFFFTTEKEKKKNIISVNAEQKNGNYLRNTITWIEI